MATEIDQQTGERRVSNTTSPAEPLPIDPTDVAAVRAMVWDKLVRIAAVAPPNASLLPILRELMDRIEGKAPQSVKLSGHIDTNTITRVERVIIMPKNAPLTIENQQ